MKKLNTILLILLLVGVLVIIFFLAKDPQDEMIQPVNQITEFVSEEETENESTTESEHIGLLRGVEGQNGNYSLTIDYVQYIPCSSSEAPSVCDNPVHAFGIKNENPQLRTFSIAETARIEMSHPYGDPNTAVTLSVFSESNPIDRLFWVTVKDDTVTRIIEEYRP